MAKINKKANYLLIPAVLILWGGIFMKVRKGIGNDSEGTSQLAIADTSQEQAYLKVDTIALLLDYRDPFLSARKVYKPKKKSVTKANTKKKKTKEPIVWPTISYKGFIKSQGKEKAICIIHINEQSHLMKEKDIMADVQLLEIAEDSVLLAYKKEQKFYQKK